MTKNDKPALGTELQSLFERMADEFDGTALQVDAVLAPDRVRLRALWGTRPSRAFELRLPRPVSPSPSVLLGWEWPRGYVEVRVRGLPHVQVSDVPSAVLAVALR